MKIMNWEFKGLHNNLHDSIMGKWFFNLATDLLEEYTKSSNMVKSRKILYQEDGLKHRLSG